MSAMEKLLNRAPAAAIWIAILLLACVACDIIYHCSAA